MGFIKTPRFPYEIATFYHFGKRKTTEEIFSSRISTLPEVFLFTEKKCIQSAKGNCGMNPKKKVILVEDHAVTRVGVKHVVNASTEFEVVGEAEHSSQIAPLLAEKAPDFMLLDLRIPGENVLNLVKDWKKSYPNLKVVTLTMLDEQAIVHSAIEAGVDGYLLKSDDLSSLTKSLTEIASGKTVYSKNLKMSFTRRPQDGQVANKKEKQILTLLGQGKTYQEIGTEIGLSKRTVEYHVGRLKERFSSKTVAELIGRAKEQMLI